MKTGRDVWDWRTHVIKEGPENAVCRHVLLTLSCYMDSAGQSCFPSIDKLIKATQLSRPTVIKYLKMAQDQGWIRIKKHGFGGQEWARNDYTATLPESTEKAVKEVNHHSEGSKPHSGRQLNSFPKVVKEVNSISTYTSSNNSLYSCDSSEEWQEEMGQKIDYASFVDRFNELYRQKLRLTGKKRTMIRSRLRTFTGVEIVQAWENRLKDEWLNGEGIKYLGDWSAAMRNDEKIEKYLYASEGKNNIPFISEGRPNASAYKLYE